MRKHLAAILAAAALVLVPSAIAFASYTWTNVGAVDQLWYSAALSDSGSIAYSSKNDFVSPHEAHIWKSTDGGSSWTELTASPNKQIWKRIATSGDGGKLAAIGYRNNSYAEFISMSSNGGSTWTSAASEREWFDVAMSQSGSVVVAVNKSMSDAEGGVWRSTDGGTTWTDVTPVVSASKVLGVWRSVATSSSGQRIVAAKDSRGVFVSNDGGVTWVEKVPVTAGIFTDAAMSGDGTRMLVAVDVGAAGEDGVWVSTDFGSTWSRTLAMTAITGADISRDSSTMTAIRYPRTDPTSAVYVSRDGGLNWEAEPAPQGSWTGLALSGSGDRIILMAEYGRAQFATSTTTTTTTTVAPPTTATTTTSATTSSSSSSSTTTSTAASATVAPTTTFADSPPPAVTPSMVSTFVAKPIVKNEAVVAGEPVTVRISGFQPYELVTIGFEEPGTVQSQAVVEGGVVRASRKVLLTVRADATGTISVAAKLPTTVTGAVTLWAYGRESGHGFRQKVQVAALPRTGANHVRSNVMLVAMLLGAGGCLTVVRRRLRGLGGH